MSDEPDGRDDFMREVMQKHEANIRDHMKYLQGTNPERLAMYQCIQLDDLNALLAKLVRQGENRR